MNVKPSLAGKIVEMRLAGGSCIAVAQALGVSTAWVYVCSRGKGIPRKPRKSVDVEPALTARSRVQAEVATGLRCGARMVFGRCCLLNPCADHGTT